MFCHETVAISLGVKLILFRNIDSWNKIVKLLLLRVGVYNSCVKIRRLGLKQMSS